MIIKSQCLKEYLYKPILDPSIIKYTLLLLYDGNKKMNQNTQRTSETIYSLLNTPLFVCSDKNLFCWKRQQHLLY